MRNKILLIVVAFFALIQFGCGQMLTGTYAGSESVTLNSSTPAADQVTISIAHTNNDMITGSWQSAHGGGNLTGRPSGEVTLMYTLTTPYGNTPIPFTNVQTTTFNPTTGQPNPPAPQSTSLNCGSYTGKLTITDRQVSGRLELTQPAPLPTNIPASVGPITNFCPQVRSISATKN